MSIIRKVMVSSFILLVIAGYVPALGADETPSPPVAVTEPDLNQLGDEVDILQIVAAVNFSKEQVTQLAAKVAQINAKRQEYAKREEAILEKIKVPLQQMKDALIKGKPVSDTAKTLGTSGLKELEALRKQSWADYESYVASATTIFTAKQIRDIRRSPQARKRAGEMIGDIRLSSDDKYPQVREKFVNELIEVKKIDKQEEWFKSAQERLAGTTGEARDKMLKELEKVKEDAVAEWKPELSGLLDSIRTADSRILSVGVDKLASALRSDTEVDVELSSIMSRILDSPTAETVLKARAEQMKDVAEPVE